MTRIFNHLFCVLLVFTLFSCGSGVDEDGLEGTWDIFYNDVKNCNAPEDNQFFDLTDEPCFIENGITKTLGYRFLKYFTDSDSLFLFSLSHLLRTIVKFKFSYNAWLLDLVSGETGCPVSH